MCPWVSLSYTFSLSSFLHHSSFLLLHLMCLPFLSHKRPIVSLVPLQVISIDGTRQVYPISILTCIICTSFNRNQTRFEKNICSVASSLFSSKEFLWFMLVSVSIVNFDCSLFFCLFHSCWKRPHIQYRFGTHLSFSILQRTPFLFILHLKCFYNLCRYFLTLEKEWEHFILCVVRCIPPFRLPLSPSISSLLTLLFTR